ncbi:MAG TPA: hypothetical protein PKX23_19735, partial [Verrucomicrobiota bacterium]|nr:hypothetical protein [Verrucomicrobiota bacterium]
QGQAEVRRAEAAINEFLGTEKLPDRVRVVYEPGAPYAGYYQGGRVVVNAARTSDPVRVLLEEGLHGVVAAIRDGELNDPGLLAALNEFADKVTAADVAREQARRKGLDTRAEVLAEEATIAKVLDENPGLIERLVRAIREAFRRWFGLELPAGGRERILRAAREYLRSQNQSLPGKRVVARNAIITFPGMGAYRYAVTAYHGTRHKVDRFTTQKIGTGEGEQVYGWGLYFAEEREVAERYRKALAEASLVDASGNTVEPRTEEERDAAKLIHNRHHLVLILGEQIDGVQITLAALENTKQYLKVAIARADENVIKYLTKVVGILEQWANRGVVFVTKGNTYTVSLNIEPDKLLDWDKPLNEQSEYVQNSLRKVASELPNDNWRKEWHAIPYEKHTGGEFYHAWRIWCELEPKQISALLEQAGIQGIRYLDAESRTTGKGTYNYVIFDESRIQILAENGQPVSAAEASGAPADIRFAPAEEVPEGMGRRATGEKILGSTAVSNQTKQAITEYLYQKRTLAVDDNFAAGLIQRVGLDQAEAVVRTRPEDVPGAVWSRLLRGVTRELARREREAPLEQKAEWARRQAQLWNTVLPQITDVAQTLRALEDAVEMSPDAQVERARMEIERANGERLERRRPETDQMQQALDEGRKTGIEAVRNDP